MNATPTLQPSLCAFGFALGIVLSTISAPATANDAQTHIGHIMAHWNDTPDEQGLLPIALAEAEVAKTHAGYAASNLDDLSSMQLHAHHVLHALDSSLEPNGPGRGYGLHKAAQGVATHAELASETDGATDVIRVSGIMVSSVGRNTAKRTKHAIDLAKLILKAKDAASAADQVQELKLLTEAFFIGEDLNKDGRIVWYHHEGGLNIAAEQMAIIMKNKGL
ncbi:hypothetical protein [Kiloniella antarctica]|uniref:Uncharacterized protein n=1 Tax=Kiloniella antarctica TaxID=1550907 RepID=A0ABW5BFI1_9PROT